MVESTALGAAKLAALTIGLPAPESARETTRLRVFAPTMAAGRRAELLERWSAAVRRA